MQLTGGLAAIGTFTSIASFIPAVSAGINAGSSSNVAVFWGQNSVNTAGPLAQKRLAEYCANSDIDIIPISLLLGIKSPRVNFANQEEDCQPIPGSSLLYCPHIEEDIKTCQNTYGKEILISLGGDSYTEAGFSSPEEAIASAENVWKCFGSDITGPRPFGSAVVSGFDFDFESTTNNLHPFAKHLHELADGSGRKFIFTASPQCMYPDLALGPMLDGGIPIDAIFIQFYNNEGCGINHYVEGSDTQPVFNIDVWDKWAKTISANPNVKILLGVPGNVGGGAGYVSPETVKSAINYAKRFSSFGGVMVWDASQAYSNGGFLSAIRGALGTPTAAGPPPVVPSPEPAPASKEPTPIVNTPEAPAPGVPSPDQPVANPSPEPTQIVDDPVMPPPKVLTPVVPAPAPINGVVKEWNQCGGIGYRGPTECEAGLVCVKGGSEWWYSCKKSGQAWRA